MTVLDKKPIFLSLQKSKIKFYLILFFSASLFFRGLFAFNSFKQNEKYVEGIAAIVGEKIKLKSDVSQIISMTALQQNIDPLKNPKLFSDLQSQVLQSLIDQKIIIEMAELDSMIIDEKDVDTALDQQIKTFIEQAGGKESAEKSLGQSLKSFRREFWQEMHDRLISEQFQYSLLSKISTNRKDVFSFYNTYKDSLPLFPTLVNLNHILIGIKPGKESKETVLDTIKKIQEILSRESKSFESLAQTYSQDPGSKLKGGNLGFIKRGDLVKEFETAVFTLDVGVISEPIETAFGYHLIKVNEKQGDKASVSHILISPKITEEDKNNAYNFAQAIKDSVFSFNDFKKLAALYSDDEKTKDQGGGLGWVDPLSYSVIEISLLLKNNISENVCSDPLKSDFGYHLVWISGIKKGGKANIEYHWNELEKMALNRKKMSWYQEWMKDARKQIKIQVMQ